MNQKSILTILLLVVLGLAVSAFLYLNNDRFGDDQNDIEQMDPSAADINGYSGLVVGIYRPELNEFVQYPQDIYQIQISLEDGVLGSTAVNSIGGEYTVGNGRISFGDVFSTLIGAENQEWEIMYLEHLNNTSAYDLDGDILRFYDSNGLQLLEFLSLAE